MLFDWLIRDIALKIAIATRDKSSGEFFEDSKEAQF